MTRFYSHFSYKYHLTNLFITSLPFVGVYIIFFLPFFLSINWQESEVPFLRTKEKPQKRTHFLKTSFHWSKQRSQKNITSISFRKPKPLNQNQVFRYISRERERDRGVCTGTSQHKNQTLIFFYLLKLYSHLLWRSCNLL